MHIHFLDPYQPRLSPVHSLDGRVKFILAVAFILTVSLTPFSAWPAFILLFALIFSAEILSSLGVGHVLKRSLLALPFVLAALPLVFTIGTTPLFSIPVGTWTLTAHVEGLLRFISLALKSWLSIQAAVLMAASMPFPVLLQSMRAVGIPRLLVGLFGLMWRYLFVLVDEALRLLRARSARSGHSPDPSLKPGGSLSWRARVTGAMAGSLFLRAFERSDRIYVAMLSRGYDGEVRLLPLDSMNRPSRTILALGLLLLALVLVSAILFWG